MIGVEDEPEPPGRILANALKSAWLPRVSNGFFFRAESFFNVAAYLDQEGEPGEGGPLH